MEVSKVSIQNILGTRLDVSFHRNKLDVRGNFNRKRNNSSLKYDEITLASIASIKKGQTITRESAKSGDYPVIAGGQTSPYSHQSYNELEGAITISASGTYAGFVWYHDYKFFASDCIVVRSLDEDRVLTSFLYEILKLKQTEIYLMQRGAGQPHVYSNDIAKIMIPIPPLPTQQKIVDIYNKAKREKQEKEKESQRLLYEIDTYLLAQIGIELPKEQQRKLIYKVSISQLLGNKLDVRGNFNRKRNNSSLKYDEITLASIASIKKGQTITRESAKSGDYPVIAGGQTSPYSHQSYNELEGAITISASGTYAGFVWYHDYKFFASDCIVIRSLDEDRVLTSFLYEILKLKQTEIYLMQRGAGQPHVYSNDIAKIMIPNVPIVLQNKIVSYVNGLRNQSEEFLREASIIMDQARQKIEQVILN